jgi:hypothetical protein
MAGIQRTLQGATMCKRNQVLAAAVVAVLSPLAASASTLCVNPGGTAGCFATIAGAIAGAGPGDTVALAAGTYNERDILVYGQVEIAGAGRDLTIVDGSIGGVNAGIVFRFAGSAHSNVTIRDLTVKGGRRGIDLTGDNTATLERIRVTGNGPETGAGIFNGFSVMYLRDSLVDHNFATDVNSIGGCDWGGASGGGIAALCGSSYNRISGTTISDNVAGRWGGGLILDDGNTVIENSTISGNQANFPDGNLAGGALFVGGSFPDILVRFSTIANNGGVGRGALQADSKLKLYATLLQGNLGNACTGPITSLGYNVVSDASCNFAGTGDANSTDAMLAPLGMNGGLTPTHEFAYTSAAFDHVPTVDCTVFADQRGVSRPQHKGCDAGAVEHVPTTTELVQMLQGAVTGVGPGQSLMAKVAAVLALVAQSQPGAACSTLGALRNEVNAQTGKKITADQAAAIIAAIQQVTASLGC